MAGVFLYQYTPEYIDYYPKLVVLATSYDICNIQGSCITVIFLTFVV